MRRITGIGFRNASPRSPPITTPKIPMEHDMPLARLTQIRLNPSHFLAAFACLAAAIAQPAAAQQSDRQNLKTMVQACRSDIRSLCAGVQPGGRRIAQCMRDHASQLSDTCRAAIADGMQGQLEAGGPAARQRTAGVPAGVKVLRDIAYGKAAAQRMDVYLAQKPGPSPNAPVIVMVHGGAWAAGSKSAAGVVDNKVAHWLPKGYVFVSVATRLMPQADPLAQAADVAAALAAVQRQAPSWGGDPAKLVLMGHSAGAHLVALISADRTIAEKAGARPWSGTVALDSAAYDVTAIMRDRHPKLYDNAFGSDPDFWAKASPSLQLKGATPPMLLVCSSLRKISCDQAEAFAKKAGGRQKVLPVAMRHGEINIDLGKDSAYTRDVDTFLASVGLR